MKNTQTQLINSDPKDKDTSLPGREEEVIVNEQEQTKVINTDDVHTADEAERRYKEGLEDNNNTEPPLK
ncbi:MAG: hypothetical protein ABIO04_14240 [Ferruginibacter sp.]